MGNSEPFEAAEELYQAGNLVEALERFKELANSGNTASMLRVANMYTLGEGAACDYEQALAWERKAANAGDPLGMNNLAITYRMVGDMRLSKHWFSEALKAGEMGAAIELAKLYMVSDREVDTVRSFLLLALKSGRLCEAEVEEAEELMSTL